MTEAELLDLIGATNLIPGPNSTELAIHIGFARRRWAGLVVAGVSFILPAMLITGALGWAYVRGAAVPAVSFALPRGDVLVVVTLGEGDPSLTAL